MPAFLSLLLPAYFSHFFAGKIGASLNGVSPDSYTLLRRSAFIIPVNMTNFVAPLTEIPPHQWILIMSANACTSMFCLVV